MRRFITTGLAIATVTFGLAGSALAQSASVKGEVKFNLLSVEGLVVGKTLAVDTGFAAKHDIAVPRPFSVLVPTADEVLELVEYAPNGPRGPFFKVNFATQDRQLIENIQFVPFTLAPGEKEDRLKTLAGMLANDAFAMATRDYPKHKRDVVRKTTAGKYDAVEVIGRYEDPKLGLMYLRIVGIPDPDGPHGIFAIANVVAARQDLPTPDDFPRTRGGAAIRYFKFLE